MLPSVIQVLPLVFNIVPLIVQQRCTMLPTTKVLFSLSPPFTYELLRITATIPSSPLA